MIARRKLLTASAGTGLVLASHPFRLLAQEKVPLRACSINPLMR